ncbi:MAG: diaminopropionate ammonia-lyase [Bacteroidota bacterium]
MIIANTDFWINRKNIRAKYSLEKYFRPEIYEFHKSLPGYSPTPLLDLKLKNHQQKIYLKDESLRFSMGAFKSLGASWAIANYLKKNSGSFVFCSATDGNHGRAVAWSARIFGHRAKIFMPASTVPSRIRFIEEEGARVFVIKGNYDEAVHQAREAAQEEGHVLIQDTSWEGYEYYPNMISAGYSTIIREIEKQFKSIEDKFPEVMLLQSGVGSWAASMMLYTLRHTAYKTPKFIIVEPYESDCLMESAKRRKRSTTSKSQKTIMAGLNCGTPSMSAWEIIDDMADAYISIDDHYVEYALHELKRSGVRSCESGAAGLAGLLALFENEKLQAVRETLKLNENTSFLLFNTEGITDPEMYEKIISRKI